MEKTSHNFISTVGLVTLSRGPNSLANDVFCGRQSCLIKRLSWGPDISADENRAAFAPVTPPGRTRIICDEWSQGHLSVPANSPGVSVPISVITSRFDPLGDITQSPASNQRSGVRVAPSSPKAEVAFRHSRWEADILRRCKYQQISD